MFWRRIGCCSRPLGACLVAKGGARARSGPAPDPDALRRDRASDADGWVTLPAAGRQGDAPAWPFETQSEREGVLWVGEWRRPQAVVWERNGQELEVALYVRSLIAAESRDAATMARTLVRQQQEALGLSIPGLLRNRWRIAEVAAVDAQVAAPARNRLKVVQGGAKRP